MLIYCPLGYWLDDSRQGRLLMWWMAVGAPAQHSIRVPSGLDTRHWILFDREWAPFPF
jgi:hypothetical protein